MCLKICEDFVTKLKYLFNQSDMNIENLISMYQMKINMMTILVLVIDFTLISVVKKVHGWIQDGEQVGNV